MTPPGKLINNDLTIDFPQAVRGEGVYLYDHQGKRYLDACSGALVANLGHGRPEIIRAMADQAEELAYVYRYHFSTPAAENLAERYCRLTDRPMGAVYFANSGSEATETAVKLARTAHLAAGREGKHKVISRWYSYHGITMGALNWSGYPARRADYEPYLPDARHIPAAYCYRCAFNRTPDSCNLDCARALETAILNEGADTVAAFMAEPVSGSSLAAARPPDEYFRIIRKICDQYEVYYIAEEVMTGAGRTGGKFFASDHFPARPDVIAFGKGVGGGYYPLAGAMISPELAKAIAQGRGGYTAGQSFSGHPAGMAAGAAVLDFLETHDLVNRAAELGDCLGTRLEELAAHPSVGDVRGLGLMRGLEFVADKATKQTLDPALHYYDRIYRAAREEGVLILPGAGCDKGQTGALALIGPPLTITKSELDELVAGLDRAIGRVEKEVGLA